MANCIEVSNLVKDFSVYETGAGQHFWQRRRVQRKVLQGINFSIEKGEIVGFLGPNGAGKSTTIKILTGILHPTSGNAEVLGYIPWQRKTAYRARMAVVMGQKSQLWPDLPALESFELMKCIYDIPQDKYKRTLDRFVDMLDVGNLMTSQVRRLSLGERMKMELIAALLHEPEVIFLDEPTIGLDIQAQKNIRTFIQEYNREHGATVLLTSHQMADIETLCQRSIIINHGNIVYDGLLEKAASYANGKKLLTLHPRTMPDPQSLLRLGKIRHQDTSKVTIEVSRSEARDVLSTAVGAWDILDFEMEDMPLEETLELLYAAGEHHE